MMTKRIGKSIGGTRMGVIALVFASLFFTSSLGVYRAERQAIKDQEEAAEEVKSLIEAVSSMSEPALTLTALSACESGSHYNALKKGNRACVLYHENKQAETATLNALNSYEESIKSLSSAVKVNKEGSSYILRFSAHGLGGTTGTNAFALSLNNSVEDYSFERLFLESQRQSGSLSELEYAAELSQLSMAYAERFSPLEQIDNEQSLNLKVNTAEQQLTDFKARVESLEKQLAKAERTAFEKWCPIVTSILLALIALSAHFLAWRTHRRQTREQELLPLKQQDMELSINLKDQQLQEARRLIIIPTREEINQYSRRGKG